MTLLQDLKAAIVAREAENGWTREIVSEIPALRDPDLLRPYKQAYMSDRSLAIVDTKHRYVIGEPFAVGELSRQYLRMLLAWSWDDGPVDGPGALMVRRRVPYARDALDFLDRSPAYYFAGESPGPFALVDVDACYGSIYTRFTLDVKYRPYPEELMLGLGRVPWWRPLELLQLKALRNAVFGCVVPRHLKMYKHGDLIEDSVPNRYFAPDLMGLVFDVTNSIAAEAVDQFGAFSWAADGGCFRPDEGRAFIEHLCARWGLTASIRAEGPGWIFGPNIGQIGEWMSEDVRKGRAHVWPATDQLRRLDPRVQESLAEAMRARAPDSSAQLLPA